MPSIMLNRCEIVNFVKAWEPRNRPFPLCLSRKISADGKRDSTIRLSRRYKIHPLPQWNHPAQTHETYHEILRTPVHPPFLAPRHDPDIVACLDDRPAAYLP